MGGEEGDSQRKSEDRARAARCRCGSRPACGVHRASLARIQTSH